MEKKNILLGAAIAAMTAAAGCRHSAKPNAEPGRGETSAAKPAASAMAKGECWGVNACKGQGECGGVGHACAGENACKGKGWLGTSKEECDAKGGRFKAS